MEELLGKMFSVWYDPRLYSEYELRRAVARGVVKDSPSREDRSR
jgi:hypothetical protein